MTETIPGGRVREAGCDEAFERHRPVLLGLAYRMLGSWWDAEDVVQEAWLRWRRAVADTPVEEPRGWLVTATTRLALDQLRSARRRRESYVGPWLPEPVPSGRLALDPAESAAQRATVSLAALRLMERLSPPERAVYLLREAFELPYQDIAEAVGVTAAHARQLHRRAAAHLDGDRARFAVDSAEHLALVERFVAAAVTGDRSGLESLLARDVVLWNDGGGRARAARRPILGRDKVARFLLGVLGRRAPADAYVVAVNGGHALLLDSGERRLLLSPEIRDGGIAGIQGVVNPDKLRGVAVPGGHDRAARRTPLSADYSSH
ncbi:RNA polymerase sigma factor SigJ [Yinghuangia sp. ASG 101]|uniref:RNA polymerase sigma factor SigJ n=1 Tax=Yinghuangia sp. ASG 101 TaxID=2896848 RepID=UPI001E5AC31F|nr:RNA polymerase sigma factor SigJ [Yinghuangia sp. ASG 101]UGQ09941.1 RNA polymerase sigma factor SigJ [Yinghuangia sp. ASG 101]